MAIHSGDVVRVSPVWYWNSTSQVVNVHALLIGPGVAISPTLILDDINQFLTQLYGNVTAAMSSNLLHSGTGIFNLSLNTPEIGIARNAALDGGSGGQVLPLMN